MVMIKPQTTVFSMLLASVLCFSASETSYAQQGNALAGDAQPSIVNQAPNIPQRPLQDPSQPPAPPEMVDIDFDNLNDVQFDAITQDELATLTPVERQKLIEAQAKRLAYDAAINGLFPLKPDQIRNVLRKYDETTEAAQRPIKKAPEPEITIQNVSLDPSAMPPMIKVAPGFVTTLSILDITGEPWPIQDISWGGDFDILQPEEGSNLVRITPLGKYKYGNISMRLVDLKTPIVFRIQAFDDVVQYRFDARIPKRGPGAAIPLIESQPVSAVAGEDMNLIQILDGVPPSNATVLSVKGTDGRTSAYRIAGQVYLRTPLTLLSPAWSQSVASADGVKVYALNNAPVVLLSDAGRVFRASLSERVAAQ